ncbi:MAG: aconitate hydratase [Deltaproteobacteria bacterium]|nr:aconitate hydratase [Deltaproteobacteria bacterium]
MNFEKIAEGRKHFGRPLTLTEKILVSHMKEVCDENGKKLVRKRTYANFYPDRVSMQDATAQMAILQFMTAGKNTVQVPSSIHCDHLIQAQKGAALDLKAALKSNFEVYEFLKTASQKYGIDFWKPGSGIIHQVVLENYAFPGGMMLGTDSHTPNGGGLGMLAIGVGGADAVDVMTGQAFNLVWPGIIGVKLTGKMSGWTSSKDVILKLMGILTVKGGTNHIVEFFGDGCESISATGKGTICNMGAEHGSTTSVFPYDSAMGDYLKATEREAVAAKAEAEQEHLQADPEVLKNPEQFYDRVIHIDLDKLEPHIVGPHSPDLSRSLSEFIEAVKTENYPNIPKAALIGSCTNSSYEDIDRSASIAREAVKKSAKAKVPFLITPGSETVHATIQRDGQLKELEAMGGVVLANACGPCIGQWKRRDIQKGQTNSIISSYNRNFPGRNDGNAATLSFLASPEIVTAYALSGKLDTDPTVGLAEPMGEQLPQKGFKVDCAGFMAPPKNGSSLAVDIPDDSERLAFLKPFPAWSGKDFDKMPALLKAKGKCTTDHISPAGPWLKFRGHLDKIADNTYSGAVSAFTGEAGKGYLGAFPEQARRYKEAGQDWCVIGDENFGEGSSREHAAMQPRHLGCKVIITRSFARIHESNLKKHGVLPLTFVNPEDYEKIGEKDLISVTGLENLAPGKEVQVFINDRAIQCKHTLSADQINWFKAGSALNHVAGKTK